MRGQSKPKRGTDSISTGTKTVPVGPWGPRKIFLSSKMMNSQPQHIQKREIVEVLIIKYNYKSKTKTLSDSVLIKKCPITKVFFMIEQS